MNCQTARQDLELFRPGDDMTVVSSETERHVRGCLDCQDAIRARQEFDDQAGRICRDVPVPPGLKDRLLISLAAASTQAPAEPAPAIVADAAAATVVPQPDTARPTITRPRWSLRLHRRRVLKFVAAVCLVASAVIGIWISTRPAPPTITLDDAVRRVLDADPAPGGMVGFQVFRNGVAVKKPDSMVTSSLKSAPQPLGDHDIAVYFFTVRDGDGRTFEGKLIVIPVALMKDPPTATSFLGLPTSYHGAYCTTAWVEGPRVYICCVKGEDRILRNLQHQSV
jgi:hypothetical protein